MKTINVEIEGLTPLLMSRFDVQSYIAGKVQKIGKKPAQDFNAEAKQAAYFTKDGKELCIPAECIHACILGASSFHKINKRSAKSILAGSIRIAPEEIRLGTNKYEVDIRSVVCMRARVLKARPKLNKWKAKFQITITDEIDDKIVKQILDEAGTRVGLLSFRPQKSGFFGTFKVTKFAEGK